MKFNVEFVVGSGGTLMAKTYYGDNCIVESGKTFVEAEANLIKELKKQMVSRASIPKPKEIEITL